MKNKIAVVIAIACTCLWACHGSEKKSNDSSRIMTVTSQPTTTTLFYSGIIQPLKSIVITTPAEGVVEDMKFNYGDHVQAGQLLFTINSEKFQTDYKSGLMEYIKSKNEFDTNNTQL